LRRVVLNGGARSRARRRDLHRVPRGARDVRGAGQRAAGGL
jgi:hypothetical protein